MNNNKIAEFLLYILAVAIIGLGASHIYILSQIAVMENRVKSLEINNLEVRQDIRDIKEMLHRIDKKIENK